MSANGFLGSAVAWAFSRDGWTTYGLVRSTRSVLDLVREEIIPIVGTAAEASTSISKLPAIDVIICYEPLSEIIPVTERSLDVHMRLRDFSPRDEGVFGRYVLSLFRFPQWVGSDKLRKDTGWTDRKSLFHSGYDVCRQAYEAVMSEDLEQVERVFDETARERFLGGQDPRNKPTHIPALEEHHPRPWDIFKDGVDHGLVVAVADEAAARLPLVDQDLLDLTQVAEADAVV
ncbi:hypothetical protein AYL99_07741 [Fonsecaea erecta]|uniref:NmrA-like domain-containing protein n=1 Tax=Fonsecaea erecta TaxID=1367422 RepID=A0A178ZGQ3_9EURO|nr:hypothetical protein AYL99_07741 [Fonsecaea erecta]OAP58651.1 hypothetical protein AYL99_07741 [Fonsecaea erecta]